MRPGLVDPPRLDSALRQVRGDVLKSEERAFVRVAEAAVILGISRSAAYELANSWLATRGQAGLPAVRMGRCILVPPIVKRSSFHKAKFVISVVHFWGKDRGEHS